MIEGLFKVGGTHAFAVVGRFSWVNVTAGEESGGPLLASLPGEDPFKLQHCSMRSAVVSRADADICCDGELASCSPLRRASVCRGGYYSGRGCSVDI